MPIWLKLAQWFWRNKFLNFVSVFLLFRYHLALEKGQTNLNPLNPSMLCAKFCRNWPSGSGEEDENVKSLQTDERTDDGRQAIKKTHLSLQLR